MSVFEAIQAEDGTLLDIQVHGAKSFLALGRGGAERELNALAVLTNQENCLPVFLGAGLGHALRAFIHNHDGPFAVVEKEHDLQTQTRSLAHLPEDVRKRMLFLDDPDPQNVLVALTRQLAERAVEWIKLCGLRRVKETVATQEIIHKYVSQF